jgi:hypothetical protein
VSNDFGQTDPYLRRLHRHHENISRQVKQLLPLNISNRIKSNSLRTVNYLSFVFAVAILLSTNSKLLRATDLEFSLFGSSFPPRSHLDHFYHDWEHWWTPIGGRSITIRCIWDRSGLARVYGEDTRRERERSYCWCASIPCVRVKVANGLLHIEIGTPSRRDGGKDIW